MHPLTRSLAPLEDRGVIEARGLVKRYGDVVALAGLDLTVPEGTVLGMLGPNGAGKTTAVSILTTLLEPDAGTAMVAGADVLASPGEVRKRIGRNVDADTGLCHALPESDYSDNVREVEISVPDHLGRGGHGPLS